DRRKCSDVEATGKSTAGNEPVRPDERSATDDAGRERRPVVPTVEMGKRAVTAFRDLLEAFEEVPRESERSHLFRAVHAAEDRTEVLLLPLFDRVVPPPLVELPRYSPLNGDRWDQCGKRQDDEDRVQSEQKTEHPDQANHAGAKTDSRVGQLVRTPIDVALSPLHLVVPVRVVEVTEVDATGLFEEPQPRADVHSAAEEFLLRPLDLLHGAREPGQDAEL